MISKESYKKLAMISAMFFMDTEKQSLILSSSDSIEVHQNKAWQNALAKSKKEDLMRKRGMKKFHINGYDVWALNLKNAKRKAKNLNQKQQDARSK